MECKKIVWLLKEESGTLIDFDMAAAFLGCGNNPLPGDMMEEMREVADMLIPTLEPRYMFQMIAISKEWENGISAKFLEGGNLVLSGKSIQKHLKETATAVAGCLTLGEGADRIIGLLQGEGHMLKALFADALANAAVEKLRVRLEQDAAETLDVSVGWLFGIGYGDLPIELQRDFLLCMGAQESLRLAATEKMILCPSKSVTGFLNIKKGMENAKEACNGRCSVCPGRETCHIFGGKP
ncbi:MAG: hypothetical protein K2N63_02765 [Lachnospiraceae bacterium]|nr:hypothetical protein [Lachnospiraceae bacterium]